MPMGGMGESPAPVPKPSLCEAWIWASRVHRRRPRHPLGGHQRRRLAHGIGRIPWLGR